MTDHEILDIVRRKGILEATKVVVASKNLDLVQAKNYIEGIKKRAQAELDVRVDTSLLEQYKEEGYLDSNSLAKLKQAKLNQKNYAYIGRQDYEELEERRLHFAKTGEIKEIIPRPTYTPRPPEKQRSNQGISSITLLGIGAAVLVALVGLVLFGNKKDSLSKKESSQNYLDSIAADRLVLMDTTTNNAPEPPKLDIESDYKLITTNHYPTTENYYLLLTKKKRDVEYLQTIATTFRQQHCTKQCNISLYDKNIGPSLVTKYPLSDNEYLTVADHLIAQSTFEDYTVYMYPYQDFHYKELGGHNWKKEHNY